MKFYNHIFRMATEGRRNAHFESASARVYVRLGRRSFDGEQLTPTLEIADVSVVPEHQNAGVFKTLLSEAEQYCVNDPVVKTVYIENVMTERFARFFRRRQYVEIPHAKPDLCFYRHFSIRD